MIDKSLYTRMREDRLKKAEVCKHDSMHFEAGGLYLVCDDCKYTWAAVGIHPMRIIQDINARAMGFTEMDKRTNPMVLVKIQKKLVKALSKVLREPQREIEAVWNGPHVPLPPKPGFIQIKPKSSKKST